MEQIVLRTNLAAVPAKDMDTDRREFSKCLIVPTKNGPLACVTDKMVLAVVQAEGDVEKESAFDLSVTQLANLSMPIVVNRDGDETEVFRGMKPQDEWKPLGHTFRVHDDSDPKKFPNTVFILTEVEQDNCIVVRLDAVLLLKLAQAICGEDEPPENASVNLIVPRIGKVETVRVESQYGIGAFTTMANHRTDHEVVTRFNSLAKQFNVARELARLERKAAQASD